MSVLERRVNKVLGTLSEISKELADMTETIDDLITDNYNDGYQDGYDDREDELNEEAEQQNEQNYTGYSETYRYTDIRWGAIMGLSKGGDFF